MLHHCQKDYQQIKEGLKEKRKKKKKKKKNRLKELHFME